MYEEIRKEKQKTKGSLKLWLWVAGCVLIAAVDFEFVRDHGRVKLAPTLI